METQTVRNACNKMAKYLLCLTNSRKLYQDFIQYPYLIFKLLKDKSINSLTANIDESPLNALHAALHGYCTKANLQVSSFRSQHLPPAPTEIHSCTRASVGKHSSGKYKALILVFKITSAAQFVSRRESMPEIHFARNAIKSDLKETQLGSFSGAVSPASVDGFNYKMDK